MPWKETRAMNERMKFVVRWEGEEENFAGLCREFGISRKTGYKWLERFERGGPGGLADRPPVAKNPGQKTSVEVVDRLIELRKEHPRWGPKKLRVLLEREGRWEVPAASTVGELLKHLGMIRPRKRSLKVQRSGGELKEGEAPNDLWCTDFKGDFPLEDEQRCHPLTLTDGASRYLLTCEALLKTDEKAVRPHFERAFREFGLPRRMRSDNGPPFASVSLGGLTPLSVWWVKLGIVPERITPGRPQQNGKHERMHGTLSEVCSPGQATVVEQQRAFVLFRAEFNEVRPHEALGMKTPGKVYRLSAREYPSRLCEPEYAEGWEVRRVNSKGRPRVSFRGQILYMPQCLMGEPVGFREVGEERWELYYGPVWMAGVERKGKELVLRRAPFGLASEGGEGAELAGVP